MTSASTRLFACQQSCNNKLSCDLGSCRKYLVWCKLWWGLLKMKHLEAERYKGLYFALFLCFHICFYIYFLWNSKVLDGTLIIVRPSKQKANSLWCEFFHCVSGLRKVYAEFQLYLSIQWDLSNLKIINQNDYYVDSQTFFAFRWTVWMVYWYELTLVF